MNIVKETIGINNIAANIKSFEASCFKCVFV